MPHGSVSKGLLLCVLMLVVASDHALALEPVAPASVEALDAVANTSLRTVYERQDESGVFGDSVKGKVGSTGMPTFAFVALRQARRAQDAEAAAWRVQLASRTLRKGTGSGVLYKWPLAMTFADDLDELLAPEQRQKLENRVKGWDKLTAPGVAARCYDDPACFNNYKVVDALLNFELGRSGLRSQRPGRLFDPQLTLKLSGDWLTRVLPVVSPGRATVSIPGRKSERATVVSDPAFYPLAYHAMCTAWITRTLRLQAAQSPVLRRTVKQALWGLVGMTAPTGEMGWSGRGQDQVWSLGATLYAASAGSAIFADSDPVLAARLRRLADIELQALARRVGPRGLNVLPVGNDKLLALDPYYSETGSIGLALTFAEMSRSELPNPSAPRLRIASEIDRSIFHDPLTGVVSRRQGRTWVGLRTQRNHAFDPRHDVGLIRALRFRSGVWREIRQARPSPIATAKRSGQRVPSGGPMLIEGKHFYPRVTAFRPDLNGLGLTFAWRSGAGQIRPLKIRYTMTRLGVQMRSSCPSRRRVELTEWLPRRGELRRYQRSIRRADSVIRINRAFTIRQMRGEYANSRVGRLTAYRIVVECGKRSRGLKVEYGGEAVSIG